MFCRISLAVASGLLVVAGGLRADDFLVETKVSAGKDNQDVVTSTTFFQADKVYDFLSDPEEITLLDPIHKRFVALDCQRRVKLELSGDEIEAFIGRLKDEAKRREIVPLFNFLADPKFETSFNAASGELILSSSWMRYRVKTSPPKLDGAVNQYCDYADWQARLNTMLKPGSFPPFARLALNAALVERQRVPTEVELTRFGHQTSKRHVTIRAQHRWQWRLLERDVKRLDEANNHLVTYTPVSLSDYVKRDLATSPETAAAPAENPDGASRAR